MITSETIGQVIESDGTLQSKVIVYCLSSDSKPADVDNGSVLIEMDTKKVYFFDEENHTWREFA